mgnify:CR=1 FL=1
MLVAGVGRWDSDSRWHAGPGLTRRRLIVYRDDLIASLERQKPTPVCTMHQERQYTRGMHPGIRVAIGMCM